MKSPALVCILIQHHGISHVRSLSGNVHKDGDGQHRPHVAGAGRGDSLILKQGMGQAEGQPPAVQLPGGADLEAGDGKCIAVVMSHHFLNSLIKLRIIEYVFSRHMYALGFLFQLIGQRFCLCLLLIRQCVQPLKHLIRVHMGKPHLELPGDILQVQVRTLTSKGEHSAL